MEQEDARKLSPESQEALRKRVVHAVREQGMPRSQAARTFGVGRTTVYHWCEKYRAGGERRLRSGKRGRPRRSRLKGHQAATVVNLITQKCPDQLTLGFALWTRPAVQALLAERFDIHVSLSTVGRYLHRWGLTPQKPLHKAYEQDPAAVERWLNEEYPAIRARARREGAEIHWGDQMGLRSDHQAGTTYGRRGVTPAVPRTGQRFGCNLISTLTNRGTLRFMVFSQRFTADRMIEFLGRLLRSVDRKVFLIVDRHPVHTSKKVKQWLSEREDQLEVFFLPGYSPELNPDEMLNQDVKSNAVRRQRPSDQPQMVAQVRSYLKATQHRPEVVRSYFDHPSVTYAAE